MKRKSPCWFRHEHAKYTFALYLCLNSDEMTTIKHTYHGPLWGELTVFGFRSLCDVVRVVELSGKLWFLLSSQGWVKPVQVLAAGEEWDFLPFHDKIQRIIVWKTRLKHTGRVKRWSLFSFKQNKKCTMQSRLDPPEGQVVCRRLGCCRMCVSVCEWRRVLGWHELRLCLYHHMCTANSL